MVFNLFHPFASQHEHEHEGGTSSGKVVLPVHGSAAGTMGGSTIHLFQNDGVIGLP
jgi:hypothetical protein